MRLCLRLATVMYEMLLDDRILNAIQPGLVFFAKGRPLPGATKEKKQGLPESISPMPHPGIEKLSSL